MNELTIYNTFFQSVIDTINSETKDIPVFVEATIIQRHFENYGYLPRWNKEL